MVQDLARLHAADVPGPRLGRRRCSAPSCSSTAGRPFLTGGWAELAHRQPGMMLLISHGHRWSPSGPRSPPARPLRPRVLVGAGAAGRRSCCWATGWRCGPSARPRARSPRWPRCCPTRPSGSPPTARRDGRRSASCAAGDVVLVRPGGRVPADGVDRRRRGRARRVDGHRRVPAGGQGRRRPGRRRHGRHRLRRSGSGSTPSARTPRWPASSGWSPRPRRPARRAQALADRVAALLFYVATVAGVAHLRRLDAARARPTRRSCAPSPCWSSPAPTPWAWPSRWSSPSSTAVAARGRHPGQGPPGPGADAHGRRRAVRQDRHPDQGRATSSPAWPRPASDEDERAARWPAPSRPTPSTRWPGPSSAAARRRAGDRAQGRRASGPLTGRGVAGHASTARRSPSAGRPCSASGAWTSPPSWPPAVDGWRGRGAAVLYVRPRTARSSGPWPWRTRSGPSPARPSTSSTASACGSS